MNGRSDKYLVLAVALGIGLLVSPNVLEPVWGEKGKDYDTVQIGVDSYLWTSSPPRIWDGSQWQNFVYSETGQYIRFESEAVSFEFYKDTCDFKLYSPGYISDKSADIESFSHFLTIDGAPEPLPACSASYTTNAKGMQIIAERGLFRTIYDLDFSTGLEWTHEVNNNKGRGVNVLITDTCLNCTAEELTPEIIRLNGYTLDTKDDIHKTVRDTRTDNTNYIIEYEQVVGDRGKLVIDPTFGWTDDDTHKRIITATSAAGSCPTTGASNDGVERLYRPNSALTQSCTGSAWQWDTSSIPNNAQVDDVQFRVDVDVSTNPSNCDINQMTQNIATATDDQIWDDIRNDGGGTTYVDKDRKSTRLNSSHSQQSRMPSSA